MGGSGGGSSNFGSPGGGGGLGGGGISSTSNGGDACSTLICLGTAEAVNLDVLSSVAVGTRLVVRRTEKNSIPRVELQFNNELLGVFLSRNLSQLLRCIEEGTNYFGIITDLEDGIVKVKIEAQSD